MIRKSNISDINKMASFVVWLHTYIVNKISRDRYNMPDPIKSIRMLRIAFLSWTKIVVSVKFLIAKPQVRVKVSSSQLALGSSCRRLKMSARGN